MSIYDISIRFANKKEPLADSRKLGELKNTSAIHFFSKKYLTFYHKPDRLDGKKHLYYIQIQEDNQVFS